jgi:hypothetical protein
MFQVLPFVTHGASLLGAGHGDFPFASLVDASASSRSASILVIKDAMSALVIA